MKPPFKYPSDQSKASAIQALGGRTVAMNRANARGGAATIIWRASREDARVIDPLAELPRAGICTGSGARDM